MKWTALNSVGALLWVLGLSLAMGVAHGSSWGAWLPANAFYLGSASGLVGLATLLWANLGGA